METITYTGWEVVAIFSTLVVFSFFYFISDLSFLEIASAANLNSLTEGRYYVGVRV